MAAAAAATAGATSRTQEANENFNFKACLNDLTKIPQKEFEAQFRNWMEKDGVARAMQAKLRADLVANFNKTNLGKHIIGQTPTTRLTLTPIEMALNTLVAEFLFAQSCHFTLSVYSTEAPFRNTLPDFDCSNYFRFKENEVTEIVKAICGPLNYDWNIKNKVFKNYTSNKTTALLFFILKALLESNAETAQQKVTVGTNTRPLKMPTFGNQPPPPLSSDNFSTEQTRRDSKADFYNTNFRYLNRYLIILSRKVKDMSEQFEKLQYNKGVGAGGGEPRVRIFKSMGRRKYDDLNRSLERVTENLKQMANAKRKSRRIGTIVKAIEALAAQFQKCAENFEHVSKNWKSSAHFKTNRSTTSSELIDPNAVPNPSVTTTNAAASQTDMFVEKCFVDWLHEMRYTRNGQKFLDRIERSFLKALEKQKQELLAENEVKLRHQKELLRIRYKQKVLQEICSHGSLSARRNEMPASNVQSNETISEQFRQFELKHFDLLSKIYESDTEHRASDSRNPKEIATADKAVHFNVKENKPLAKSSSEFETDDVKITSSSDNIEQHQLSRQVLKEKNVKDLRQQVKEAIGEIVSEERNVDQIVMDAKQRIRELEQESNQLTENFLGYLDRQREQKLAAREAAQSLWHDYVKEREKMQQHYVAESSQDSKFKEAFAANQAKYFADLQNQQKTDLMQKLDIFLRDQGKPKIDGTKQHEPPEAITKHNSGECSNSSSYMELQNPIIQAKENFFERERQFKAETTKRLLEHAGDGVGEIEFDNFLRINATKNGNKLRTMTAGPCLDVIYQPANSWMATNAESANTQIVKTAAAASTSNAQLAANWQGSLERPQNGSVNKSQRREIIATAKEAVRYQRTTQNTTELTTNAILAAAAVIATATASAATTTTTTHTTIPRALNKNNAAGASVAEAQQEHSNNHKIKNDVVGYGQKHTPPTVMEQQQNEMRNTNNNNNNYNSKCNNNKTSNFKSNGSTAFEAIATETSTAAAVPISTVQTSKPSIAKPKVCGSSASNELSRKAVLKQSMARMQQLFSPHQHRQQQIMLADVSEEEEYDNYYNAKSSLEKTEKSWQKEKRMLQSINNNNNNNDNNNDNNNRKHNTDTTNTQSPHVVFDADSENVVGHYKNNLLSKQKIIKGKAKDQHQQQIPTTILRNNHEHKRTVTVTNNSITSTTLHSIDEGNKTVEALVDWQQIACGPSGRQNEAAAVNVDKVKVTKATAVSAVMRGNDYNDNNKEQPLEEYDDDDDDFERHIENELALHLPLEPGEIFESNQTPPEMVANQAEMGELLDQLSDFGDDGVVPLRSTSPTTSDVSSIDLRMSFGGGGSGNGMREGINAGRSLNVAAAGALYKTGNASDSGSDFWA